MRRYEAIRNSHGFQGRYWEKGQIAEVEDGAGEPPHHFKLISDPVPAKAPEPPATMSLSQATTTPKITTGMAAGLSDSTPKTVHEHVRPPAQATRRPGRPRR